MERGRTQDLHFDPTLTPGFLLKMTKIEKIRSSQEKLQPLSYPNMSKSRLYLLSPFWEKYFLRCLVVDAEFNAESVGSNFKSPK